MTIDCIGYAAHEKGGKLSPYKFVRRELTAEDVLIEITFAGICHSDIHSVRSDWGENKYPLVPGHEIIGLVKKIGSNVTSMAVGDTVGIGPLVDSCGHCHFCGESYEQFCDKAVFTYAHTDKYGATTYGGYSDHIVCDARFVFAIPSNLPMAAAAPLLCAGVTTYAPLKEHLPKKVVDGEEKVAPGSNVAIVGLGGLGHMGLKFAKAMGCHVTVISTSPQKKESAFEMGADDFVLAAEMDACKTLFDVVLDSISGPHSLDNVLTKVKPRGKYILLGIPKDVTVNPWNVIAKARCVTGSLIGGNQVMADMLQVCGKHNIVSDVEIISAEQINDAYDALDNNKTSKRFVIDVSTMHQYRHNSRKGA